MSEMAHDDAPFDLADFDTVVRPRLGAWAEEGACREHPDPDIWFPTSKDEDHPDTRRAKAICRRCPVQADCLRYALEAGEEFGIWGGESERARDRIRRWTKRGAA